MYDGAVIVNRRVQTARHSAPQTTEEPSQLSFKVLLNIPAMIKDSTFDRKASGTMSERCCILHAWHQPLWKTHLILSAC